MTWDRIRPSSTGQLHLTLRIQFGADYPQSRPQSNHQVESRNPSSSATPQSVPPPVDIRSEDRDLLDVASPVQVDPQDTEMLEVTDCGEPEFGDAAWPGIVVPGRVESIIRSDVERCGPTVSTVLCRLETLLNSLVQVVGARLDEFWRQTRLAQSAFAQFHSSGNAHHLDRSLLHLRNAVAESSRHNDVAAIPLRLAGFAFESRFKTLHLIGDLNEAISHHQQALQLHPPGNPERPSSLEHLARGFYSRFQQEHQLSDLDEAITNYRELLGLGEVHLADPFSASSEFASLLSTRFRHNGDTSDLHDSVFYHTKTLELRRLGHPGRPTTLVRLGGVLLTRFKQLGQMADLGDAIDYYRESLEQCQPKAPVQDIVDDLVLALQFGLNSGVTSATWTKPYSTSK